MTLNADTDREAWLAARREGIGASEIAAVMGISPWESPFSIFWRKRNGWDIAPTEIMETGTRLEPAIADWWAHEAMEDGWDVVPGGLYQHDDREWQLATPDRLVIAGDVLCVCDYGVPKPCTCDDPFAVLECKWVAHSWDGWGEPGTDEIPVHYRAQVLWQCDVMDLTEWHVAALGPGGFRAYHGEVDEDELKLMRAAGAEFMRRLAEDYPPPLDSHSATLATLKRLHPDLEDVEVEVSLAASHEYLEACASLRIAETRKDAAEIRLRAEMGNARRAVFDGERVTTRVISEIAESTRLVKAHRRDYLLPPRGAKP